jgi:uncharacterized membrane protein
LLGAVLRVGVLLAAAVVLAGGLTLIAGGDRSVRDYRVFSGEPAQLRSVSGIVTEALARRSRGLIQLGLLFLIATPIARVLFSILAFARERDWLYVAISALVLGLLGYSLLGGAG